MDVVKVDVKAVGARAEDIGMVETEACDWLKGTDDGRNTQTHHEHLPTQTRLKKKPKVD